MGSNHYNNIAFLYDLLSRVLGKSYRKSKHAFLEKINKGDKVLYIGGGTGENLPEILERSGERGMVIYMEASSQMIEKAKMRIPSSLKSQIQFLHQSDFLQIPLENFNLVLTQYFLDILPDKEISKLFETINIRTDRNTEWIFVDFFEVKGKRWLLGLMIRFFQIFTGNLRKDLPQYDRHFNLQGWEINQKQSFDKGFIQAWLLKRDNL